MLALNRFVDDAKFLQAITAYKMNKVEAKAWRVAILYLTLAENYFPAYKHYRLPKGDPRKSLLFRYCYKLVREYGHQIESKEYRNYIRAQFEVLRKIERSDAAHGLISPNCLVGEHAWRRWMLWKRKLGRAQATPTITQENVLSRPEEVKVALDKTKEFLTGKKILDSAGVVKSLESRAMMRWAALGDLSPYYLVISPIVNDYIKKKGIDILDAFAVDLKLYQNSITQESKDYFRSVFPHEYSI